MNITVLMDYLTRSRKEHKKFKKEEIKEIFTEINYTKFAINMMWFMKILKMLNRRASDEVSSDRAFIIAKNSKYDRYQLELASCINSL